MDTEMPCAGVSDKSGDGVVKLPVTGKSILTPSDITVRTAIDLPGTGNVYKGTDFDIRKDRRTVTGTKRVFAATLIMLAIGTGLFLYLKGPANQPTPATGAMRGAALYAEHCAACHGANLEGQPNWRTRRPDGRLPAPPHDETGHTWHHPDHVLFAVTKRGTAAMTSPNYQTDMRGFGDVLSDEDIWAVLDFIKSRWPEEIRKRQATITARQQR